MKRIQIWLSLTVLVWSAAASADVVGPMDSIDCPTGASESSCHGSQYCSPDRCTDDDDCANGATCEELDLCMDTRTCGGWNTDEYDEVEGACAGDGVCSEGTCESVMVCVPEPIFRDAGGGCSCSRVPHTGRREALLWTLSVGGLFTFVVVLLRRRS